MKILLISPYIPYPPITGGKVRVLNFLKNMQKEHEVTLLCLLKNPSESDDISEVEKVCHRVIPVLRRPAWSLSNLLKTAFSRYPFLTVVNNFSSYTESSIMKAVEEEKPDIVHLETFYMSQSLLAVKERIKVPVVLSKVDVEAQVYFRNAKVKSIFNPLKYLGYLDAWKMLQYEVGVSQYFDHVTTASRVDLELLTREFEKRGFHKDVTIIPNGVDSSHYAINTSYTKFKEPSLVFVGNFRYFANTDAAFYFHTHIWPLVLEKVPNAKFYIIGPRLDNGIQRSISGDVGAIASADIIVTGYVPEEKKLEYLSRSWVCVAPLRIGSGTKLKILEAMAMGLPVVATSVGMEGIEVTHGENGFVEDDPSRFADTLVKLLQNEGMRRTVGQSARALIEHEYDWAQITQKLVGVYHDVLEQSHG